MYNLLFKFGHDSKSLYLNNFTVWEYLSIFYKLETRKMS